ncbi:MAG TPA: sarcosine oxidase subunit delta [Dongiaceae bacterium]|nr:sarcosine oxidase subunit delta [Dongiaceae bacterium]
MQQFPCPWCGLRAENEFRYIGDAGIPRPPRTASDAEWAQYLYFRSNAKGAARELWIHSAGCGRWFELDRNTATHDVAAARPMTS